MIPSHRVIWSDNGTLKDLTPNLMNYISGTEVIDFNASQDALYLGSELPFNHRWFELSVASDTASTVSAKVWGGNTWNAVAETIDLTKVAGVSLAQSGIIYFSRDRLKVWDYAQTTEDIPALSSLKIYNLFWLELKWSANWKTTTALKYIGHKFSSDEDLESEYPTLGLSSRKTAFKSGKTDWNEQHFAAAEYVIQDLIKRNAAQSRSQIMDWRAPRFAALHKTAQIIFNAFGEDYKDDALRASIAYQGAMKMGRFDIDQNADGRLDGPERETMTRFLTR